MSTYYLRPAQLDQRQRVGLLGVSIVVLIALSWITIGRLVPNTGSSGLWFYSAAFGLILGDLVVEPLYTRPADAIVNAGAVLLASATASAQGLPISSTAFEVGQMVCIAASLAVLSISIAAVATKPSRTANGSGIHRGLYYLSGTFGSARVVFWSFFVITATAAFADEVESLMLVYLIGGGSMLFVAPAESLVRRIGSLAPGQPVPQPILIICRLTAPTTIHATGPEEALTARGDRIRLPNKQTGIVVRRENRGGIAYVEISAPNLSGIAEGARLSSSDSAPELHVVGSVAKKTRLDSLVVDAVGSVLNEESVESGGLFSADVRGDEVLYQVTEATIVPAGVGSETGDEAVEVCARKIGTWRDEAFHVVDWIPEAGTPVRVQPTSSGAIDTAKYVGRVPGTEYGIKYNTTYGVTHNTAVLGILGVGKTTLAADLIWRVLDGHPEAKVVVVDITGEYSKRFDGFFGPDDQSALETRINSATATRRNDPGYDGEGPAGNVKLCQQVMNKEIEDLFEDAERRMMILNPSALIVTQDDGGFSGFNYGTKQNEAKRLVSLTPAEVTAIISRAILSQVQGAITDDVRACLVLEEAHSLAPEYNSRAHDGEATAAIATARCLMQGRKYGFGSIVVTQRTANVTKSILNQCNTVFALRVFDQTGTDFMANFIGRDYANLIPTLKDRHAVYFGKASSCASPLLIRVNEKVEIERALKLLGARSSSTVDNPATNPIGQIATAIETTPEAVPYATVLKETAAKDVVDGDNAA